MPRRLKLSRIPGRTLMLSRNDQPMAKKRVLARPCVAVQRVSAACSRATKSNLGPRNGKPLPPFGEKASCTQAKTLCLKWELGSVLTIQMWKPAREKYPLYTSAVTSARADRVLMGHSCLATVVYKTSPGRCLPDRGSGIEVMVLGMYTSSPGRFAWTARAAWCGLLCFGHRGTRVVLGRSFFLWRKNVLCCSGSLHCSLWFL